MTTVELAAPAGAGMRHRALALVAVAACGFLLIAPALWNGFPLLQNDTGGYLARWFEGYLVPSRPGAYGLLLTATAPLHFWPVLVFQTAATIWVIWLLLRAQGLAQQPWALPAVVVALAAVTTLPWLTAILLTDIFAGLAVLALYLCVFRGEMLRGPERIGLVLLIAFAAATHSATYAVLFLLTAVGVAAAAMTRGIVPKPGALRAAAAVLLGTALTYGANFAVSGQFAWTPGGYSILFGRMLQDGIVSRYLNDHCRERTLRLCPFRGELPLDADAFLWGGSMFDRLGRFAGMRDEMRAIVLGSLTAYPGEQVRTAAVATARQLVRVRSGEGVIDRMWHTYGIIDRYTPSLTPHVHAARQQRGEIGFEALNRIHEPVALFSIALIPALLLLRRRWRGAHSPVMLAGTVGLAILANAFVCGALANPHDRYGARIGWIATLTVAVALLSLARSGDTAATAVARGGATRNGRDALAAEEIAPG